MSDVLKDVLTDVVARMVHHVGFEYASSGAIDLLTMVLYKYLLNLSNSIANVASGDGFFDIMDGVAILDLMGTSVSDLNSYISEVGPYFPEPPEMSIPLAGKVVYFPLQSVNPPVQNQQSNQADHRGDIITRSELASDAVSQTANDRALSSSQSQNLRKLPPWARKSTYKLTKISYDWTAGRVIEHRSPSPIPAVAPPRPITPAARRSARSSVSAFRRPRASPLLADSNNSVDTQRPISPRPVLTADEKWKSALKATLPASPSRASTMSQSQATVSDVIKPEPRSEVSPAPISSTQPSAAPVTSAVKEAPPNATKSRNQQGRKRGAANRRRSHPAAAAAARRPVQRVISAEEPHISPSPVDTQVNAIVSQSKVDTPENRTPGSILGSFDSSPELCTSTLQTGNVKSDVAISFNRPVSEATTLLPATPTSYKSPKLPAATSISSGQEGPAKHFVSPHRSLSTPSPYVSVDDRAPASVEEEPAFGGHEDVKSLPSDASTIPMVDEDVHHAPEIFVHFSTRRNPNSVHSGSSSSSSLSSSSSNSSASSSPLSSLAVDAGKSKAPLVPSHPPHPPSRQLSSSTASVMSDRPPLRHPPVENPSPPPAIGDVTALKPIPLTPPPPPQPPSRPNIVSTLSPVPPRQPKPEPYVAVPTVPPASERPIRIKIRLGGNGTRENETPAVINSTVDNGADDGESSTSSSSSSSTASSTERISDVETSSRRHAAIPPALVARDTRPAVLHPPPPAFTTATATPTQPGKIVIKFGDASRRSSVVRIADSRPVLVQDKLRGSSISSEESSSSSSSSNGSISDDGEMLNYNAPQQHMSRPPTLPLLPTLTELRAPVASSSYLNPLPSLQKPNETGGRKMPPQLKPLTITAPSIPSLPLALHTPPSGLSASRRGGARGSRNKHLPPVLDPLPSIAAVGPVRATTKRSLVDSVFSDDDGEEAGGAGNPLHSLGGRRMTGFEVSPSEDARSSIVDTASVHSRGSRSSIRQGAKRRKIKATSVQQKPQAVPVVAQEVIASTAGTSYYINDKGEQIWWCPVCHREDDGSLMICCDSCSDWYHCACLGMTEVTESAWFCPNCAKEQEKRSGRVSHTKKSKKHSKGSRAGTSRH